jgi:hypothetical protein
MLNSSESLSISGGVAVHNGESGHSTVVVFATALDAASPTWRFVDELPTA